MLTWMQHHKKYLVVTIWVSVIAFVGAGFVGWGAYDFNLNRSASVALVGDEKITFSEFNTRYNQIFDTYNQISNGALSEEQAKELGLENIALNALIEDKLLLNFARDLGLSANEQEILKELASISAFHNANGVFDKDVYYELLRRNHLSTKDFETSLANGIILAKLDTIFKFENTQEDFDMLASSYFMQDDLKVGVIDYDTKNIKIDEEELKKLWQTHKDDYKTQKNYEIASYFVSANIADLNATDAELEAFYNEGDNKFKYKDFSGKILDFKVAKNNVKRDYVLNQAKNIANAKFLELKDSKINFENNLSIDESAINYPLELLARAKEGTILRPFEFKQEAQNGYLIVKINKINPAKIKTYEQAREEVLPIYLAEHSKKFLEEKAKKALENFQGVDTGFIERDSVRSESLNLLNDMEFTQLITDVFNSEQNRSYVLLSDNKAALYKIEKQNLKARADKIQQYQAMLTQSLENLKANALKNELLEELRKEYAIEIYYKGN